MMTPAKTVAGGSSIPEHWAGSKGLVAARALLWSAYDYIGAHDGPLRQENESNRSRQRVAIISVAVTWILGTHVFFRTTVSQSEAIWIFFCVLYAAAALGFCVYLRIRPKGGVHVQYTFMVLDPILIGWALYAASQLQSWFLVLMLVTIVRTGFRYGINAMKVALGLAWFGALLPICFGSKWHLESELFASVVFTLGSSWWLFAPLIRTVVKAKQLEIEREIEKARLTALQDSLKGKSDFLSRVSHELRSPLQGVISAVELLEERFDQDVGRLEIVSRLRHASMAISAQLRDLLTLARSDAGKMEVNPVAFEARELVTAAVREFDSKAATKGLEIVLRLPDEPIFVVADPIRIDQVLRNLLDNAIRHTASGNVQLTLLAYDQDESCIQLEISDTGPGIKEELLTTIFEPFASFGHFASNNGNSGLGLAIVRSVLHVLGGSITVDSRSGVGTSFKVIIPAELVQESARRTIRVGFRALVVDDRDDVLRAIAGVLRRLHVECDTAASVSKAANLLGAYVYDIVLIDLDLPIKSGVELAAALRRGDGPNCRTKLVSISASDTGLSKAWQFDEHLVKPITKPQLESLLSRMVIE